MARPAISLNHVIVYVRDVKVALGFYRDRLGFRSIEETDGYARLRGPRGSATIALHAGATSDRSPPGRPIVLYFETASLRRTCARLRREGVRFDEPPRRRPWGWDHAYLKDPDGHRISLYSAGRKRFRPTPR